MKQVLKYNRKQCNKSKMEATCIIFTQINHMPMSRDGNIGNPKERSLLIKVALIDQVAIR